MLFVLKFLVAGTTFFSECSIIGLKFYHLRINRRQLWKYSELFYITVYVGITFTCSTAPTTSKIQRKMMK